MKLSTSRNLKNSVQHYNEYTLSWSGWPYGYTNTTKRRLIRNKVKLKHFSINTSKIDVSDLVTWGVDPSGLTSEIRTVTDGIVLARAYYDGTSNTGKIYSGHPVVLDTVTGKAVTGIHDSWGDDEYTIIGTALKDFDRLAPYTGDEENRNIIPIRLIKPQMNHIHHAITVDIDPLITYPRYNSLYSSELPIMIYDYSASPLSWHGNPPYPMPKAIALSTVGWLPPDTPVEVNFDGDHFVIIKGPSRLVGFTIDHVYSSSTDTCIGKSTPANALVQIAKNVGGVYNKQKYLNGEPVLALWKNLHCKYFEADSMVSSVQERSLDWLLDPFDCECESSSSEPPSESSESPSESSESPSESSESPSESESESESASEPPSESASEPPSESASEPPSESESGKSSAIVPVSWNEGGYAALYVLESPDVRFEDIMIIRVKDRTTTIPIDFKFIDVCEAGSLEVCGYAANEPINIGVQVVDDMLKIKLNKKRNKAVRVVVKLSGVRKGFSGIRFSDRTRRDFIANERFLKMARAKDSI